MAQYSVELDRVSVLWNNHACDLAFCLKHALVFGCKLDNPIDCGNEFEFSSASLGEVPPAKVGGSGECNEPNRDDGRGTNFALGAAV